MIQSSLRDEAARLIRDPALKNWAKLTRRYTAAAQVSKLELHPSGAPSLLRKRSPLKLALLGNETILRQHDS